MNDLPCELPKEVIKWLRSYGYALNNNDEKFKKIKNILIKKYPYEYYLFVDMDIREQALKIFEGEEETREFFKTWDSRFKREKKRLIKDIYGLEKKSIR